MIIKILETLGIWVALVILFINLIGFIVRGLVWSPPPFDDAPTERVRELLRKTSARMIWSNRAMTAAAMIVTIAIMAALFHYFGNLVALAACLIMISRIPDLIWEIRKDPSEQDKPQGIVYMLSPVVICIVPFLIWFSL